MKHKLHTATFRPRLRFALLILLLLTTLIARPFVPKAKAASFSMKTGYYVGNGVASRAITGLGFQPQLVMIKSSTTAGVAIFKSSAMPTNATAFMSATANNTASSIAFNANGFTLGTLANANTANVIYTWTAFAGSDCTSTGNFCVGTYTGNGAATNTITTGFQPSIVWAKRSTAVAAHFRTASMAANRSEFFTSTAADTTGTYIASMGSTNFTVGLTDNASAGVYYYVAFKSGGSAVAEGTYTGNGVDNRNITGVGFKPSLVLVKNSTSTTVNNRRAVMSSDQHNGDNASFVGDAVADLPNYIQALQSDGFQVGSGVATNESTFVHYWFAIGGAPTPAAASGSFSMAQGTYTGTGAIQSITSTSFTPDLVIIKDNAANFAVFRTSMMKGDITAYLASATADFATGITSLNTNGFSLGVSTVVNTTGNTYHWQAFGNAYNPDTNSGAADFAVGAYYGNGIDSRDITALPYQPDYVVIKRNSTSAAVQRSSANTGDQASHFTATADAANEIQSFATTGFQVGTSAATNTAGSNHRWFAFKNGTNFTAGSYTGDGLANKAITTPTFSPDLIWIKRTTAIAPVLRPSTLAGDATQNFLKVANVTDRIKTITQTGFTLGVQAEVNASAGAYRYVAWRSPPTGVLSTNIVDGTGTNVTNPSYAMNTLSYLFDCNESIGTLGTSAQKIRVSNQGSSATWTTSVAATDGSTGVWRNGGNTQQFDYNDTSGSPAGCSDGGDTDSTAGKLRVEPSAATLTPQSGCSTNNISLGSDQNFSEGTTNAITLLSASSGAEVECYWDLLNVNLRQYVPASQPPDSYNINLTITSVSS